MTAVDWSYVYVVYRVDQTRGRPVDAELDVTIKEAFPEEAFAESEARRLNELNEDKGYVYSWQKARYYATGRALQPRSGER